MIKVIFLILISFNLYEAESILIDPSIDPLSDEMVNAINSLNTTWKAKRNFVGLSFDYVKGLAGSLSSDDFLPENDYTPIPGPIEIPESFDSRDKWSNCPSISHISDQGNCGSCWAVSAVEVMSDRICINSSGKIQVRLSAQDVLSCFNKWKHGGCINGDPRDAWNYWARKGIVTGGDYEGEGCRPYEYPPCIHTTNQQLPKCTGDYKKLPICNETCQSSYNKKYEDDKYFGLPSYRVNVKEGNLSLPIQAEIKYRGPVQATFRMSVDFFSYGSGVYQPHALSMKIEHSVRIIGWGVDKINGENVDYWLVANTWGKSWGDYGGYFKVKRGKDTGIELKVRAAVPKFKP